MDLPEFFRDMLLKQYDEKTLIDIEKGLKSKRTVTLRVNTIKASKEEIKAVLDKSNILYKEVTWFENALVIQNAVEEDIQKLPIYDEGKIYLQSLSSMLPPIILNPKPNDNILDMAAAPRWKDNPNGCPYK